ncbi:unnamed protein product [Amaranthus hypochondriacus]
MAEGEEKKHHFFHRHKEEDDKPKDPEEELKHHKNISHISKATALAAGAYALVLYFPSYQYCSYIYYLYVDVYTNFYLSQSKMYFYIYLAHLIVLVLILPL